MDVGRIPKGAREFGRGGVAVRRFFSEGLEDHVLDGLRYRGVEFAQRPGRSLAVEPDHLRHRIGFERHLADQHLVEDDAEAVDVGAAVYNRAPRELFRRCVVIGSGDLSVYSESRVENLGDAEIQDADRLSIRLALLAGYQHDVARLQGAANDVFAMCVFDGGAY